MPEAPASALRQAFGLAALALRALKRDARSGQFVIIALALLVAVAGITAVETFTDRVRLALAEQSSVLLAADLAILSSEPIPDDYRQRARARRLATSEQLTMRSVVAFGDALQLVEIKAVDAAYPLRGQLEIADAPFAPARAVRATPPRGTVWVDPRLLQLLKVQPGDELEVGAARLRIAKVLVLEPDRAGDLFSIAPRLLMNLADIGATRLVLPGSRLQFGLLLAGEREAVANYRAAFERRPYLRLVAPDGARPEIRAALAHAEQFLSLATLVATMLAGVAVLIAARSFAGDHVEAVALLRTLGATKRYIAALFTLEILLLGIGASVLGAGTGYLLHSVLAQLMSGWLQAELPPPGVLPLLHGAASGVIALLGFGLPPLLKLRDVPPIRILRRDVDSQTASGGVVAIYAITAIALLTPWHAGDLRLTAWALAGLAACLAGLVAAAYACLRALAPLRKRVGLTWRAGLANLSRRRQQSILQILALGLGIMAMLLLSLIRTDLLDRWQASLPADAPDQFLINVQPDEAAAVADYLRRQGLPEPALYPMIRGRLLAINSRPVRPEDYEDPRARRLADREFNLSWAANPKADNRIVAGRWWRAADPPDQFSVEVDIAQTLGVALGDTLTYRIAEREVTARVTSLREVNWDTMQANFFVVAPPALLREYPATFITSFKLPAHDTKLLRELVQRFPSVTIIDVAAIIGQLRAIMERAASAVEFVFIFTLIAGVIVLAAAVQSTQAERIYDCTLMKTLGASRRVIVGATAAEFLAIGSVAGLIGGLGALLAGWLIATNVLRVEYAVSGAVLAIGLLAGIAGVVLAGVHAIAGTLKEPVASVLRRVS